MRPPRRAEPQPLSAAALEYRSLQRPRRTAPPATGTQHRRRADRPDRPERSERPERGERPERPERNERADRIERTHPDTRDLYAVTEL